MTRVVYYMAFLLAAGAQVWFDCYPPGDQCMCSRICCRNAPVESCCDREAKPGEAPEKCPDCFRVQIPERDAVPARRAMSCQTTPQPCAFLNAVLLDPHPTAWNSGSIADLRFHPPRWSSVATTRLLV